MNILYVSSDQDTAGQKALQILAANGRSVQTLSGAQAAPGSSIAIFSAPARLKQKRRPRYFCLSAVKLSDDLTPDWARTTTFRVAVCRTEDRVCHQRGFLPGRGKVEIKSTFSDGVLGMATVYERWLAGKSGWLVPWASLKDSVNGTVPASVVAACEWVKRVQPQEDSANLARRLQLAQRIQTELRELPLGFGLSTGFDKTISPEPLWARSVDVRRLERQAPLIKSLIGKCLKLYRLGLDGGEWGWVTDLVDGTSSVELTELSHHCARFEDRTPLLVRADQPDFGISVEFQIPGAGWGYMDAIERSMRSVAGGTPLGVGFAEGMLEFLMELSGRHGIRVLHASNASRYLPEQKYFAQVCNRIGDGDVTVEMSKPWELQELNDFAVVRRPMLDDFLRFVGAGEALRRYFSGDLLIDPPPCLLYGQKVSLVLPFDPRSSSFFTDEERALLPETYLVRPDHVPPLSGRQLPSWSEVVELKGGEREWVIKYAGFDQKRRGGAVAVWNLGSKDSSSTQVRELLDQALADWQRGQPWIIQRRVKRKFPVTYLGLDGQLHHEEMYARITPMYNLGEHPRLIAASVNLRRMWKVHGQPTRTNDPNVLLAVHQKKE